MLHSIDAFDLMEKACLASPQRWVGSGWTQFTGAPCSRASRKHSGGNNSPAEKSCGLKVALAMQQCNDSTLPCG